jgi:di/tricarboxylate transporter
MAATASATASTSILGLGLELAMLGVATGVASISDDVGNIMLVFMIGLFLLFMMHHTAFTSAIPNLFAMLPATATS